MFLLSNVNEGDEMKRNKKLLTVLALNSLAVAAGSAQSGVNQVKYDQLYNKMIKNAETGKSHKSNYELLENILNKKNKEFEVIQLYQHALKHIPNNLRIKRSL